MGASDSLLTKQHPEEIRKELTLEIFRASERLNRLIGNLLNMSRLESGRITGSKAGGTGLGLSIAKGFVEAQKGTISVENRQNGGAKFTIKIPTEILSADFKE